MKLNKSENIKTLCKGELTFSFGFSILKKYLMNVFFYTPCTYIFITEVQYQFPTNLGKSPQQQRYGEGYLKELNAYGLYACSVCGRFEAELVEIQAHEARCWKRLRTAERNREGYKCEVASRRREAKGW